MGTIIRKRENKWISRGKNAGLGDQPKKKEKTNGLVQVKTAGGGPTEGKEKTNRLVQVKTGVGDQHKEKNKQMD